MSDKYGLARSGFWLNHGDKLLNELQRDEVRVAQATDDANESAFRLRQNVVITAVRWAPDTELKNGTTSLVNQGTAGTADSTVASYTAHSSLTPFASVDLTLSTASGATEVDAGEVLTWKRDSADGDGTVPGGLVEIEYTIVGLDK